MDVWKLTTEGYNPDDTVLNGNRFLAGNGYMGVRGIMDEWGRAEMAAVNIAGCFDKNGDKWREPINAPNGISAFFSIKNVPLILGQTQELSHRQTVDYRKGLHIRETEYADAIVRSERFASMQEPHLLVSRLALTAKTDGTAGFIAGIDTDIWDINGPHLFEYALSAEDILQVRAVTGELNIPVAVSQGIAADFAYDEKRKVADNGVYREISFDAVAGRTYAVTLFCAVYTGKDTADPAGHAAQLAGKMLGRGYDDCLDAHVRKWESLWNNLSVEIEGDAEAARAMNASLYHLHSIAPRHAAGLSVPARGLSGQTYKGAIFWDSELFILPVFTLTAPELARSMIRYRIETLPGALAKAREYGYRGAFYPWESQEGGTEGCTDYNVIDVFTHRPVRTYFRDKQIHISGDIAYAIWKYYDITGDIDILKGGGAEVILQCARFYLSRAVRRLDTGKTELLDVVGPDEYHERVDNNVFTNLIAAHCMRCALEIEDLFVHEDEEFIDSLIKKLDFSEDLMLLKDAYQGLMPRIKDGEVIEQFDGYFKLEDCTPDIVRGRLLNEREYWGTNHGIASQTQVIKQADVITAIALFPGLFSDLTAKVNWEYYEPRTEHGSSLSACMYALTACRIGRADLAWPLFMKAASIDVTGSGKNWAGEVYIGGTHPAANGSAWLIAVHGFAGLSVKDGKPAFKPCLPEQIKSLRFPLTLRGGKMTVTVTHDEVVAG